MNVLTLNHTTQIVPQAGEIALEVDGLVKSYGKVVAVCGISFQVPKGLVVGLLGPNEVFDTATGMAPAGKGVIKVVFASGYAYWQGLPLPGSVMKRSRKKWPGRLSACWSNASQAWLISIWQASGPRG
jgi:ABC-2 type transport system ATP-binding protein